MARFNTAQFDSLYLTEDGTSTGTGDKCEVLGLDALDSAWTGTNLIPISGKPFSFDLENDGAGLPLVIKPYVVTPTFKTALRTLFDAAIAADSTIRVLIAGDTGSFDLNCKPKRG